MTAHAFDAEGEHDHRALRRRLDALLVQRRFSDALRMLQRLTRDQQLELFESEEAIDNRRRAEGPDVPVEFRAK